MGEPQSKKRRLDGGDDGASAGPTARFRPTVAREWTVSAAIPTSILADCVTRESRTTMAGRIARALAIFSVDEVVVYDDSPADQRPKSVDHDAFTGDTDPAHFLEHILTYLETPPFMRKALFPLHPNLKAQGLLPNLDMPPHPHKDEWLPYREGITLDERPRGGKGTVVDIGMPDKVTIAESIPPKTRLTLKMPVDRGGTPVPVHPTAPRTEMGYYWGYTVRKASSLSGVLTESPYEDGYDKSIGTSERGLSLARVFPHHNEAEFNHLIVVFGGPRGLEYAAMNDAQLSEMGVQGPRTKELFDHWVNVVPNQGSRSIRTDEAMLIALGGLKRLWDAS